MKSRLVSRAEFNRIKTQYLADITQLNDSIDISNYDRLDEYAVIDNLRRKIIFIPFYRILALRYNEYLYYRNFTQTIDTISTNEGVLDLFDAYNIITAKKFGYYIFMSIYTVPEEFEELEIPANAKSDMIIQHFQDNAVKLVDDIFQTSIVDNLTIESLNNSSRLELHLEPIGYYELIALNEYSLKITSNLVHAAYLLMIVLLIYLIFF